MLMAGSVTNEISNGEGLVQATTAVLASLSCREREVLSLIAKGQTDRAIAAQLFMSPKTLETHVRSIFQKLDLHQSPQSNRRVLAVLCFLQARGLTLQHPS